MTRVPVTYVFARTPYLGPHSLATDRVRPVMPALATE